jgi:hypothetical protein
MMSSRIKITLPEHLAEQLDELAAAEGEPRASHRTTRPRASLPNPRRRRAAGAVVREPRAAVVA